MRRIGQMVGGVVLAVVTAGVVTVAGWALWLGVPLLAPPGSQPSRSHVPLVSTDARISRKAPAPTPRSGVVTPGDSAPRPTTVAHRPAAGKRSSSRDRDEVASASDGSARDAE